MRHNYRSYIWASKIFFELEDKGENFEGNLYSLTYNIHEQNNLSTLRRSGTFMQYQVNFTQIQTERGKR